MVSSPLSGPQNAALGRTPALMLQVWAGLRVLFSKDRLWAVSAVRSWGSGPLVLYWITYPSSLPAWEAVLTVGVRLLPFGPPRSVTVCGGSA